MTTGVVQLIAIEASSYGIRPNLYYLKGTHIPHQQHCRDYIEKLVRFKELKKSDLYVECPEVPK